MSTDEMNKLKNPVAMKKYHTEENKAKPKIGRPREEVRASKDKYGLGPGKVECPICGKVVSSKYMAGHRRTKYHQSFEVINRKLKEFIIDNSKLTAKRRSR